MACPMGYSAKLLPEDVPGTFVDASEKPEGDMEKPEMVKSENPIIPERDPELFKPVTEPVILKGLMKEPAFALGGQYAILMQFAHPRLAKGSYLHSNFADRIMGRLITTARYLSCTVFGTPEEIAAITSVIHRYHSRVKGEGYDADDPELHKWTAATVFMSFIACEEMIWGPPPRYWMEQLYKECAIFATELRMPTDMWPKTLDDFFDYWNETVDNLIVTDWARKLAEGLLYPKLPWWFMPIGGSQTPFIRLMNIYWLPERIRKDYGFKDTPLRRKICHMYQLQLKVIYRSIPRPIRIVGDEFRKMDLKKSVKNIEKKGHW